MAMVAGSIPGLREGSRASRAGTELALLVLDRGDQGDQPLDLGGVGIQGRSSGVDLVGRAADLPVPVLDPGAHPVGAGGVPGHRGGGAEELVALTSQVLGLLTQGRRLAADRVWVSVHRVPRS